MRRETQQFFCLLPTNHRGALVGALFSFCFFFVYCGQWLTQTLRILVVIFAQTKRRQVNVIWK